MICNRAYSVGEIEDGFTSLFNGKDFSQRKIPDGDNGHWCVVDGVVDYDAESETKERFKDRWTKMEFGDFILKIDWRIKKTCRLKQLATHNLRSQQCIGSHLALFF